MAIPFFRFINFLFQAKGQYSYYPVWLCLSIGLILSATASSLVNRWEKARQSEQFKNEADNLAVAIQQNLDESAQIMRSLGALYDASEDINRAEFAEFSRQKLTYASNLIALGWAKRVEKDDRAVYEEQMKDKGLGELGIWEYDSNRQPTPASEREEYFPNTYVEPSNKLQSTLGYDRDSELQHHLILHRAIDTSDPEISLTVTTKQVQLEKLLGIGFVMYRPVYKQQKSDKTLEGILYAVFRAEDVVGKAVTQLKIENLDFYLYQSAIDQLDSSLVKGLDSLHENFLVFYESKNQQLTTDPQQAKLTNLQGKEEPQLRCPYSKDWTVCIRTLNLEGQEWSLLILPKPGIAGSFNRAGLIFIMGLLGTSSITIYLGMSIKRVAQTEKFVKALQIANQASQEKAIELEKTLSKLKTTQGQLVHTEKMSSLGQLVAGVAHEINNPISFIYGNIDYASQYARDLLGLVELYAKYYPEPHVDIEAKIDEIELDFLQQDFPKIISSMEVGTKRIQEIIRSMRNFSRMDEANMKAVNIHEGIDSTLMILGHRLKAKRDRPAIKVIREYGDLPMVECNAGQLNQVFMNLLSNSIDAIEDAHRKNPCQYQYSSPNILIKTETTQSHSVTISITDNGLGIPAQIQSQLFDPFFTTKPIGKGTGLGLSISYQIVTEFHKGQLQFISLPGKGTKFIMEIPIGDRDQVAQM